MVLADFEINIELDPPRAVRVVVYDNVRGLRIAATRYDNITRRKSRRKHGRFSDTLGICHRFERHRPNGTPYPQCAIVRLAKPEIGVGIISHEMAHAAIWIWGLVKGDKPLTCANDELFAWILGELVRQTINVMDERGVYDE